MELLNIEEKDEFQVVYDFYRTLKLDDDETKSIIGYTFLEKPSIRPYNQKGGFIYSMSKDEKFESHLSKYSSDKNISINYLQHLMLIYIHIPIACVTMALSIYHTTMNA